MKFTFYGHACFLIETNGTKILFDPFISKNPAAKEIDIAKIECDYIAVSHAHFDHIADLVAIAKNTNATVIGTFELGDYLTNNDINNFHLMNIGGGYEFDFAYLKMVSAIHSNSFEGKYMGLAAGFVIETPQYCLYYAGDTALHYDMKLLKHRFKINTAILPIGGNYTMDYKDALIASDFVNCNQIIGVHFNTEPLIEIKESVVATYFKNAGKKLLLPKINQTVELI